MVFTGIHLVHGAVILFQLVHGRGIEIQLVHGGGVRCVFIPSREGWPNVKYSQYFKKECCVYSIDMVDKQRKEC